MRKSLETIIDLVYFTNVLITPFIAVHWKKFDQELLKREKIELQGKIRVVKLLLLNYADFYLLIDLLSSLVGICTFQRTVHYFSEYDVLYVLKIMRLFGLVRLYEQIQMLTETFVSNYRSRFPKITYLIPLIQVLLIFVFVIHQLSWILAYMAFKRGRFGDSWYF